jgi:ubiquinone biosynthesis protein COQ9
MSSPDSTDWAAQTEARLLDAALPLVPACGFTRTLVRRAAERIGLAPAEAELLLPKGPRDLAALLSYRHDEAAMEILQPVDPAGLKVRERIARGVEARVEAAMTDEAAVRRWMGYLALPQNLALGARLTWESADRIWRWAGDVSADENHYSKRAILAGLISSTLAVRLAGSPADAQRHLERGIGAVMAYETAKRRFSGRSFAAAAAQTLGRFRYGGGASAPGEGETASPG